MGFWEDAVISGRSDTAVIRSLRDGRRTTVAVRFLQVHDDLGLTKEATSHPAFRTFGSFGVMSAKMLLPGSRQCASSVR